MKAVLVTGGTIRLGKAIADRLAQAGWRVLRSSHRADSGADIVADLSRPDGADKLFAEACRILGRKPDAIVNNAALYVGAGSDEAAWQVNFESPKRLASLMSGGKVVNILDKFARRHAGTAYARSKEALAELTRKNGCIGIEAGDIIDLAPTAHHERAIEPAGERLSAAQVADLVAAELDEPVVELGTLFASFVKMGAVLIGGGYALLPLLDRELVERRRWAKAEEMLDFYALAQLLPGVIAVNTAMLVGNRLRGVKGTVVSALGLTLVPFVMIVAYAAMYTYLKDTAIFAKALVGVQSAVAGMILGLGVNMVAKTVKGAKQPESSRSAAMLFAAATALAVLFFDPAFAWLIVASLVLALGVHFARFASLRKEVRNG